MLPTCNVVINFDICAHFCSLILWPEYPFVADEFTQMIQMQTLESQDKQAEVESYLTNMTEKNVIWILIKVKRK